MSWTTIRDTRVSKLLLLFTCKKHKSLHEVFCNIRYHLNLTFQLQCYYTQFPFIRNVVKTQLVAFHNFGPFLYSLCFLIYSIQTVSVSYNFPEFVQSFLIFFCIFLNLFGKAFQLCTIVNNHGGIYSMYQARL